MFNLLRKNKLTSTESVDIIEKIVYEHLKPLGFRKYGRTLHRFTDGDISQVINFQNGCPQKGVYGIVWVNLGIRVQECVERTFVIKEPIKKYYKEYECNIRSRLGLLVNGKDTFYTLKKDPRKIADDILNQLDRFAMPIFNTLNTRDAILQYRRDYPQFDDMFGHQIELEESMIFGRRGNLAEASRLFNVYYQSALAEYNYELEHGTQDYLEKGEKILYFNHKTNKLETVTAKKSGFVTIYNANNRHIKYLESLANELGIEL